MLVHQSRTPLVTLWDVERQYERSGFQPAVTGCHDVADDRDAELAQTMGSCAKLTKAEKATKRTVLRSLTKGSQGAPTC
jgi:hypothetical protein